MRREDFDKDNCKLFTPVGIFMAIYAMSSGNPCKGCSYVPECDNHYKLHPGKTKPPPQKPSSAPKPHGKRKNKNKTAF